MPRVFTDYPGNARYGINFVAVSSQYAQRNQQVVGAYPFTIACWFKTGLAAAQVFFSIADVSVHNNWQRISITAAQDMAASSSLGGAANAVKVGAYADGLWHLAVGIFTSNTNRAIYVDNAVPGTDATNVGFAAGIDAYAVGRSCDASPSHYLTGTVDEACVWDIALDAAARTALWNGGDGVDMGTVESGNIQLLLHMNEGDGATAADSSGNGWDATLFNAPAWDMGMVVRDDPETTLVCRELNR